MRAALDVADFLSNPLGSYVSGSTYVYWCARPRLCGFSVWGRPSVADVEAIVEAKKFELFETTPRHCSVADGRRLTGIDVAAYEVLARHVAEKFEKLGDRVERLAYLPPGGTGVVGAVAVGFFEVNKLPYPVGKFDDLAAALAWLGHPDPALAAEIDEIQAKVTGETTFLGTVRRLLSVSTDMTSERLAQALDISERTLQRRLAEAGTSFLDEVALARIKKAETLMLDSDLPIAAISAEVGFASPQHFSRRFREIHGEPPTDWRARRR